jgi:hypothetical protein
LDKEYLSEEVFWQVALDATAIESREYPARKGASPETTFSNRRRKHPKKGKEPPALERKRIKASFIF